jgi:NAD-dependent DNA ligase
MNAADAAPSVTEVREPIHHHDYLYCVEARPEISEAEYDRLVGERREERRRHKAQLRPGQRITADPARPSSWSGSLARAS